MLSDLKFALRSLGKARGFAIIVVAILAIGIGANTAIFAVVNAFLLRPLAYDKPDELVSVYETAPKLGLAEATVSGPKYLYWLEQNSIFQDIGAFVSSARNLTGIGEPAAVETLQATPSLLHLLKVRPLLGRVFASNEDEAGNHQVAILGYRIWQQRFSGRQDVMNQTVYLDGVPYTIVGVMPRNLQALDREDLIFVPLAKEKLRQGPDLHYYRVIARLRSNVSVAQAQSAMTALAEALKQSPAFGEWDVGVRSAHEMLLKNEFPDRRSILLLQATVMIALLLVSANVANLLLARCVSRRREIVVRLAVGASRWQVMRPVLLESVVLALLGGILGALLAQLGIGAAEVWLYAQGISLWTDLRLDLTVLSVCVVTSVLTGILFGWIPAWRTARFDPQPVLKEPGRGIGGEFGQRRLLAALTVTQTALALLLLVAAGLLVRNLSQLMNKDPGFKADHVLAMRVGLTEMRYRTDEERNLFVEKALEHLKAMPQVQDAAVADLVPMGDSSTWGVWFDGPAYDGKGRTTNLHRVSADYFRTLGVALSRGRTLSANQRSGASTDIVVNEAFVRKYLPDKDPMGARVYTGDGIGNPHTIVGIVEDQRTLGLTHDVQPTAYVSTSLGWFKGAAASHSLHFVVRTRPEPMALAKAIQDEIRSVDPDIAFSHVRPLDWFVGMSVLKQRMSSFVIGSISLIAVLLAALGVYGVMANAVTQRTHEMGIRIALGARYGDVLRLVVGYGLMLTSLGIILGLGGALAFSRVLESFLTEISPTDPSVFTAVTLLLASVALFACYWPARRATKVDPLIALRAE